MDRETEDEELRRLRREALAGGPAEEGAYADALAERGLLGARRRELADAALAAFREYAGRTVLASWVTYDNRGDSRAISLPEAVRVEVLPEGRQETSNFYDPNVPSGTWSVAPAGPQERMRIWRRTPPPAPPDFSDYDGEFWIDAPTFWPSGKVEWPRQWVDATRVEALRRELGARFGVELDVGLSHERLAVDKLVVPKPRRGGGIGTEVMKALTAFADRHGLPMVLTPTTDFGATSRIRLVHFYRRFGFVPNSGKNKDFTTSHGMLRPAHPARFNAGSDEGLREAERRASTGDAEAGRELAERQEAADGLAGKFDEAVGRVISRPAPISDRPLYRSIGKDDVALAIRAALGGRARRGVSFTPRPGYIFGEGVQAVVRHDGLVAVAVSFLRNEDDEGLFRVMAASEAERVASWRDDVVFVPEAVARRWLILRGSGALGNPGSDEARRDLERRAAAGDDDARRELCASWEEERGGKPRPQERASPDPKADGGWSQVLRIEAPSDLKEEIWDQGERRGRVPDGRTEELLREAADPRWEDIYVVEILSKPEFRSHAGLTGEDWWRYLVRIEGEVCDD